VRRRAVGRLVVLAVAEQTDDAESCVPEATGVGVAVGEGAGGLLE